MGGEVGGEVGKLVRERSTNSYFARVLGVGGERVRRV